ncbi:LEPR-XLL domain-containing protein [Halieaceae bacterium IMCC8485]|uniref:LEPR-XLL domain-containing protein n=1 Tax=Candidatus Seongchinamella marina TaxID=2518990 RepID=A0ABT3SU25_9GAMM|nr:LEPR-XLL domain-containing protein [Candidatus Seongchinamella marina]MCX2973495.1 LEPR-XLL domain-containing protein [Candidatus Seongchinamella marina]
MNKPVCITQTREQLLQRLSTRRPLYQAIKENLPNSKALHAELMEPRVLLSADLVAAAAAVDEGLEQVGDLLDQFFDDDLLNADVPLLVLPSDSGEGVDAATLADLMSLDINLVGDDSLVDEAGERVYSEGLEDALQAADTVDKDGGAGPDGKVSLGEFFDAFFEDELKEAYSSGQSDTEQALGNAIAAIDDSALITELAGLGFDLDIGVAAQPVPPVGIDADSDNAVRFELDVSLSVTRDVDVDLGTGFESLGVTFNLDSDLRSQTITTLDFDLVVGADSVVYAVEDSDPDTEGDQPTPASADFYLELDDLNAETVVNPLGLTNTITAEDVQIGFLGVAATGSISLRAGVEFDAKFPDTKLRVADLTPVEFATNFAGQEASATNALSGSFLFSVDDQFFDYVNLLDIALVLVDPFGAVVDGDRFDLAVTVGDQAYLDELSSFNRLDPASFLTILGKVASAAEGVSDNEAVSGFDIPFTSTTVGDVLDFVDLVQDKLLYSDELGLTDEEVEANPDQPDPGERLLDRNGRPTFKTIQELSVELADILASNTPLNYDKDEKELTLDLSFDKSVTAFDVPLDFNLDLGPLGDISNGSGSLQLRGSAGLGLTLGIDLGAVPTSDLLQTDTPLVGGNTSVDIENQELAAITGGTISDFTLDSETDLAGTATFTITLAGTVNKDGSYSIEVADLGRTNMTDLIADINDGLNSEGISLYVQAVSNGDGWYDLRLSGPAADGDDTFTVSAANSVAQSGLGLDSTAISGTLDNPRSGPFTKDEPLVATKNSEGGENITLTISGVDLVVKKVDLGTNSNILLLVNDLNKAIEGTALDGKVEISSSGRSLVVSTIDPGFTNLTVAENHPLGFYGDGDAIEEASEESSGNLNDFIITTTDGGEYGVSLSAATDIEGVIDAVAAATSNKVTLTIDPDSGDRLVLTQAETVTAVGLNLFSVAPTNGSRAAVQLGIVGVDGTIGKSDDETPVDEVKGADGVITGSIIAGPSLADRVFLEDAQLRGSVDLTASNVSAVGSFGFVDVSLAGDGGIEAGFTVGLKNPDDQSNKFTLAQLQNFFFGESKPTLATVTNAIDPSFTVNGEIDVTLGVETGVPGIDTLAAGLAANPIIVTLESLPNPENANLPSLSVNTDYSGLSNLTIGKFTDIGFSEILDGIILATDFLSGLEEFEFLNEPIPLVNASVTDFLSLADKLDAAVQSNSDNPSGSLQELESGLKSAFGIAPEDTDSLQLSVIDVPSEGDAIRIDLELDLGFSEYVGIDLDIADAIAAAGLPDLLAGASLAGSAGLAADGSVTLSLAFGVGLTKGSLVSGTEEAGNAVYDGNLGDVYVFGGKDANNEYNSGIDGDLSLVGTELNFRGAIGPAGIFVKDGEASAFANFGAGLKENYVVGSPVSTDLFDIELDADLYAVLPVSFPTEGSTPKPVTISAGATQQLELGNGGEFINPEIDLLAGTADIAVDGLDTLLSGFNPADQGLLDNILLVVDGVDLFLSGLQDVLDGEVGGMTLPLVGDSLADGTQFIADFRENFVDNFREGVQGFANPDEESIVDTLLTDLLAQIFPDLVVDENTVIESTNANDGGELEDLYIQWDVNFGDQYTVESGIGLDLGLEDLGLALETEGSVGLTIDWALDLGFGLSRSEGAYLDLEGQELSFGVDVDSNAGITGTLFFLQLAAQEGVQNTDFTGLSADFFIDVGSSKWPESTDPTSYRVGFSDLGSLDFEVSVLADALVDLDLTLRIDGADSLPEIKSGFELVWALDDGTGNPVPLSDISGDTLKAGLQNVGFKNVRLDAGSFLDEFLSPVLSEIQEVTGPIEDIVDFITAPLPVISDLGPSISLLDIAEAIAPQQLGFIESIDDLLSVINSIPTDAGGLEIPFGDFAIFDRTAGDANGGGDFDLGELANNKKDVAPTTTAPLPEAESNPNSTKGKAAGFLEGLKSNGSLQFPFLSDPSQVFGLLTGGDIDLFEFVLKPLGVEFEYSQFFPIIGPLGASISGSFSAVAKLAFGFDTSGINQFAETGFSDPGLIFNGFYLDDYYGTDAEVPELELDLALAAAAELNLGVAKGGVSGGVYANVQFDLNDPNLDSKVRVEELLGNVIAQAEAGGLASLLAPLAVFDVSGDVYAQLKAFLEVDVFLFSISFEEDITPPITIFEFDIPFTRPVQLATEFTGASGQSVVQSAAPQAAALTVGASAAAPAPTGTVLQLSVGELADLRLNGDITDGNDDVTITESGGDLTVTVRKDGNLVGTSTYAGIPDTILVRLGDGNDSFDASGVTSDIDFQIYGGSGNDTIILGTGSGAVSYVEGGVGDDLIVGTGGEDILIGEAGNDVIFGQGGADVISGDALEISETATLRADSNDTTDGNDWIAGGTDADIIFGAGGVDTILGDAMWSDVAESEVLATIRASAIDGFVERDGTDLIIGDGGLVDLAMLTSNPDTAVSLTSSGAGSADTIRAGGFADRVYGGKGDDNIRGGSGNDTIYGEDGRNTIYGGANDDTIYGGDLRDELYGDGGEDWIYGEGGDDYIQGDDDGDKLFGGFGADEILGNAGNDSLRGGGEGDQLFGGAGNDYLDGDFGDDVLFGDTDGRLGVTLLPEDFGNDELVSTYGTDILDGQAGSDDYVVNFIGGTADRLVTTFDSGNAATGPDNLTINGSVSVSYDDTGLIRSEVFRGEPGPDDGESRGPQVGDDNFLLRANPNRTDGLAFVALLGKDAALAAANQALADAQEALDSGDSTASQAKVDTARELAQQLAAADSGDDYPIERVDYTASMETLIINSGFGRDYFALDDNRASTTINGGSGNDVFQIGQMFNLARTNLPTEGNIQEHPNPNAPANYDTSETDIFATIETTRGFLSNGITEATTINGGDDNDSFVVFHNKAVLSLNGDDGNDEFTVRAFALSGSQETFQERTDISGGTDADLVQYAVNAPVDIDGGDGEDTVRVIGTEFGDDFIVAKDGVFGVGVNVTYTNVEGLTIDGGAGNDRFFIQGTNAGTTTTVVGGLGSDSFNVAGDPPPIISNDLLGHSGTISHTIETAGETYEEVRVRDVVANVADSNEPGIVITPADELPRVIQSDGITSIATYQVVLTQAPKTDEEVIVTAVAPRVTNDDDSETPLIQFVGPDGELTDSIQIVFDGSDWNEAKIVSFTSSAEVDLATDESRLGNLVHSVKTERISAAGDPEEFVISGLVASDSNEPPIITLDETTLSADLPDDGSLIGATIKVLDGLGEGQTRGIGAYEGGGVIALTTSWNIVPDNTAEVEIRLVGGEIITGDIVSAENRTTLTSSVDLPFTNGNAGGDLRGSTVEIISGTGAGQERLVMSSTATGLTLNKPWTTELDETSVFQVQSYSAVKAPALEVRVDGGSDLPLPVEANNTPSPGIRITESNGSTNVIEPTSQPIASEISTDSYDVVLTEQPDANVKVYVQPEETITTRGQVFYKEIQVEVGGGDLLDEGDGKGKYLLFTPENYADPQTVVVSGLADEVVDGGDTKVFPSIPRVLSDLQGDLILQGAGESDIAIGSLGDPLMLPLENNTPPAFGDVVYAADTSSVVVSKADVDFALTNLGLADKSVLYVQQYTFEITEGAARGQAVIIENIVDDPSNSENYLITFDDVAEWDEGELPDATSRFTFSTTNPNLLVSESEQVDIVTIFNNESVTNDRGTLTEDNFSLTLGGADDDADGSEVTANITYQAMENITVNLGRGDDQLTVEGTHTRLLDLEDDQSGGYQTVTFVNAGPGNDEIDIDGIDSFLAVKGETGDDTIDASDSESANALIAFGDEGKDTIQGGAGNDILFGDLGRIDYFEDELNANSQLVTRVGLEFDFDNMFAKPESASDPLQVPADQTDGITRDAKLIVTRDAAVGDVDNISGNGGDDIIIAGTGADEVDGGSESDLILGDNARITLLDQGGNLSELNKSLAEGETRLYSDNSGASADELEPNVQRLEPYPENLGTFDRLNLILINHKSDTSEVLYGNDVLFGGADNDFIFGQLGADTIRGEGNGSDTGEDYIEGNGGNDTIYGDKGQDVLIGGSSDLFGLSSEERIDGSDLIYGGTGNKAVYNEVNGATKAGDADLILGDNARVATLPGLEFNYNSELKVRVYTLLDYLPGVDNSAEGLGGADELHGELGNDTIHGMIGNDVLFGESQDDNLIGGVGYDRIYGGSGVDGILGDDGLIQVSRNGTAEPLNGVDEATSQQVIRTKGKFVGAVVNPNGEIHKAAELHAWDVGGNDVIYGGLGDDFIHGGSGDDAISGAEALEIHYHSQPQDPTDDTPVADYRIVGGSYSYNPANPLEYNEVDQKLRGFNAEDPRPLIADFLLNFDQDAGTVIGGDGDGIDRIFGDMGNDWIVGGTGADRMFGGLGDDLINADDNLTTPDVDNNEYNYGDFAYGGGGLDVLIANTGRDRLFDWNGEYNSFYVPFSRFGAPTVNRKISPDTVEFIEQLGEFSGADLTLGGDSSLFDELGLVDNADELTKEQKGSPRDPQPGNMKGKFDDAGEPEELNLLAADFPEDYSTDVVVIDDLRAVGQAAVERWLASGELNDAQLTQLSGMVLHIADLGGLKLAQASSDGKTIYIDSNAAGYGWFVDSTAMQDEEFQAGHADAGNVAGKMDLLSVVMHEIGHQLGFGHGDSGVMHESLDAGVRSAGLLAEGGVYTFEDDSGLATATSDEHDHGWVEVAAASEHSGEQSAQVDWNDSF